MVRSFPLSPLDRIAKNAGAERVSASATRAIREVMLETAEKIAGDSIAIARHAGRVTIKSSDIRMALR